LESKYDNYDVAVKLWGDIACFTRPEFKVDRVTYPVITPAAARGALESIFWKPEMRWEIREIWVLNPVKEIAIMRNEISHRQSMDMQGPFFIEDADRRQQRASLFLKDPAYLVLADIRLKASTQDNKKKYIEMAYRRLERGQCRHQPYLGTRECSAFFEKSSGDEKPIPDSTVIGNMLFDTAYCPSSIQHDMTFIKHENDRVHIVEGFAQHIFFDAILEKGVMKVPLEKYLELYRLEGLHVKGVS